MRIINTVIVVVAIAWVVGLLITIRHQLRSGGIVVPPMFASILLFALSRSPKVLQQVFKPEMFGTHTCFTARLLWREVEYPRLGIAGQGVDRLGLAVGGDEALELSPQLVHGVELRGLLGQP